VRRFYFGAAVFRHGSGPEKQLPTAYETMVEAMNPELALTAAFAALQFSYHRGTLVSFQLMEMVNSEAVTHVVWSAADEARGY